MYCLHTHTHTHHTHSGKIDTNAVRSSFPSIVVPNSAPVPGPLGYVAWQGRAFMEGSKAGNLTGRDTPATGIAGGPFAVFDEAGTTVMFSPASAFLDTSTAGSSGKTASGEGATILSHGVRSTLTSLPSGYSASHMLVIGSGITATTKAWGDTIRGMFGTKRIEGTGWLKEVPR